MGLDITAYRQLRRVPEADALAGAAAEDDESFDYEAWEQAGYHQFYPNEDFPGRAAPIEADKVYVAAESFGFRAGSYSGYNVWRSGLAQLAGYDASDFRWEVPATGPFVELVNFSDCEGVLGSVVCAKLAADFAAFQEKADAVGDDYWRERYAHWRKAVEMGADGGAVDFH